VAELLAEIDVARENAGDAERQIERARENATDAERQIERARTERLRLLEEVEVWRSRAAKQGWTEGEPGRSNPLPEHVLDCRREVSFRFLAGDGIEIGALHCPLPVPEAARVSYVDRMSTIELRGSYPELGDAVFVGVDVIDDGEKLARFGPASLDFVIACHMLEHCENPIGMLRNHLEKLREGGLLYYAVPDKRSSFDVERPLTPFDHLIRDDTEGPEGSRRDHYVEFARLATKVPSDRVEEVAQQMMDERSSIHFHVWDEEALREFVDGANEYLGRPYSVEHFQLNHCEMIAVLRKG
jgi:SAM-dependent methyltransferase